MGCGAVLRRLLRDGVPVVGTEHGGGRWFVKCEGDAVGDACPLGLGICWCWGPRVGLRGAGQPWAGGRNPVGIGGGPC
jgi:hypothetical protein